MSYSKMKGKDLILEGARKEKMAGKKGVYSTIVNNYAFPAVHKRSKRKRYFAFADIDVKEWDMQKGIVKVKPGSTLIETVARLNRNLK